MRSKGNGTRTSEVFNLTQSCLRLKLVVLTCYERFNAQHFLTEEQWKTPVEMEAALHESSRLATSCQNENNLNTWCTPVMSNLLHGALSSGNLNLIDTDTLSTNKEMFHAKRLVTSTNFLMLVVITFLSRGILEWERIFFGNTRETDFSRDWKEAGMRLSDREKTMLFLYKITCCSRNIFCTREGCSDVQATLKSFYADFCVQCEAHNRNLVSSLQ